MPLLPPPPTPLTVCALVFALFQTTTQLLVLERTVRVHQLAFSKVRRGSRTQEAVWDPATD